MNKEMITAQNPIIWADIPDVDIIRVEDTYYMVSTTMHSMPGGVIFRSYDLANWEVATYMYDILDGTPAQRLDDKKGMYSAGMWAASLRWHKGRFYCFFIANDTRQTYVYSAERVEGPWTRHLIDAFYHDCSVLFDDDGRVYVIYGNGEIHLTELLPDLSGPKPGGINKIIIMDNDIVTLRYEGSHFYKINGKYYIFLIHWRNEGTMRRVEAAFVSDRVDGIYKGKNVLDDDMGYHNAGVAQGGIVDTPEGDWYAMLFQDHGAVGRIPVLVPMHWENDFPVLGDENGKVPKELTLKSTRPGYEYAPIIGDDDFEYEKGENLPYIWQWNHIPDPEGYSFTERPGYLRLKTLNTVTNFVQAKNTLTQRTYGPQCWAETTMDFSGLKEGDYAGLGVIQSHYGILAVTQENGRFYLIQMGRSEQKMGPNGRPERYDSDPGIEHGRIPIEGTEITLRIECDFRENIDLARFYYKEGESYRPLGETLHMLYTLDHFMGYRFALFNFATKEEGGHADFDWYHMGVIKS